MKFTSKIEHNLKAFFRIIADIFNLRVVFGKICIILSAKAGKNQN